MKENQASTWFLSFITGRGTYQETKFDEDAEKRHRVLPRSRLHPRQRRRARAEGGRGLEGQEDALDRAADSGHRRARATRSATSTSPATRSSRPRPEAALQAESRASTTAEKKVREGFEKAHGDLRRRRLLEFTGYPGLQVPRRAGSRPSPEPPEALRGGRSRGARGRPADRRRDDADAGRAAVLRQPHHVHRQHDDARQRHPARAAAVRRRRLQHRSAEVQHQAAESARLLQAARRHGKDVNVEKTPDATTRSTSS